ncbi:MAG: hypothetical protein L0332_22450 [Chloroflexi bacterium]|nr:hypothetical protein [Chloroflexota bacterium]MCI0649020.1 hypothetical protein [Chloroflexota bacterium]MCI0729455.1 hypothetical protein [Chloroflexota bacterium]
MSNEAAVHLRLDQGVGQPGASLVYRPWSTRTLKVKVSTTPDKENLPPLRLRTRRMADAQATGMTCGYADEGEAFLVSWGGGHEEGPCLKADDQGGHAEECVSLKAGVPSTIYLNVKHQGDELPEMAAVTLEAYAPANGHMYASLPVTLQKPADLPAGVVRLAPAGAGWWQAAGDYLADYDARWWPAAEVTYQQVTAPSLSIRQDNNRLLVEWPGQGNPAIIITDNTSPSLLSPGIEKYAPSSVDFELFNFDQDHFVLRIWFFWLNTNIGFKFSEQVRHEVPDAERFDFLIRKKSGKVVLACTDFHWQEVWGQVVEMPLNARYGFTLGSFLKVGFEHVGKKIAGQSKHKLPYNPRGYVERLAEDLVRREAMGTDRVVLAKGWQAHVPTLFKVEHDPLLASSDVRLG